MKKLIFGTLALAFVAMLTISTQSCKKSSSSSVATLYDTLGGTTMVTDPINTSTKIEAGRLAIRGVVDSALYIIAADTAINGYFTVLLGELTHNPPITTGFSALEKNLVDFFCVGTGAKNFTYGGKSMTAAHDPSQNPRINQKVAADDFNQFVNDIVASANKNHVPANITGSLGKIIVSLQGQVVQR